MIYKIFSLCLLIIIPLWITGVILLNFFSRQKKNILPLLFISAGTLLLMGFTFYLWNELQRPIFRTIAETRLWYAVILSTTVFILYLRWKINWLIICGHAVAIAFLLLNYFNPDNFDKTLMPALQSPWFIPHVITYILAYTVLSGAAFLGIEGIVAFLKGKEIKSKLKYADNLVYIGFPFLTFGLLFGALWGKQAWGHYWTWDPKETWALITWMIYLIYIHLRLGNRISALLSFFILVFAVLIIFLCWMGINYLPSARGSIHVY